jgi:hypothetical protein
MRETEAAFALAATRAKKSNFPSLLAMEEKRALEEREGEFGVAPSSFWRKET